MVVCWQCQTFADMIQLVGPTPGIRDLFNEVWCATWDELRDFLSLHFWSNTRLETPYWLHCRHDTDISTLRPLLDFYTENGPTGFARKLLNNSGSQFGLEGFLVMLVGDRVPYKNRHTPTEAELRLVNAGRNRFKAEAMRGLDVREALAYVKHPNWQWFGDARR
jgi:tryptophan halogenase